MALHTRYPGLYCLSADISNAKLESGDLRRIEAHWYVNGLVLELYDYSNINKWTFEHLVGVIRQLAPDSVQVCIKPANIQYRILDVVLKRSQLSVGTPEYLRLLNEFFDKTDSTFDYEKIQPPPTSIIFRFAGIFTFSSRLCKQSLNEQNLHRIGVENFTNGLILELIDYANLCQWTIDYITAVVYAIIPESIIDTLSDGTLQGRIMKLAHDRLHFKMGTVEYEAFITATFDAGHLSPLPAAALPSTCITTPTTVTSTIMTSRTSNSVQVQPRDSTSPNLPDVVNHAKEMAKTSATEIALY
ncbi:uncharacterized protein LOC118767068 [Octopus sinensis]|uniref:Uncharacterized protein LOC118767068 n=1 Tax=Octopus sinensis TaxID=2607531 RepID=A0A7E6FJA7_9MOLL|nr:uncharacterized protein LOC118767068 [Octopus sinensis]